MVLCCYCDLAWPCLGCSCGLRNGVGQPTFSFGSARRPARFRWLQASEEDQAEVSLPTSASMGQLARASTIAEEGGVAGEGEEGGQAVGLDDYAGADAQRDAGESVAVGADSQHSSSNSALPTGQRPASGQAPLSDDIRVDAVFGYGGAPIGQVSPASDFRRGSMSPGVPPEGRYARRGVFWRVKCCKIDHLFVC